MDTATVQEQAPARQPGTNQEGAAPKGKSSFWRRPSVMVIGTLILGGLLYYGLSYFAEGLVHESTDDAFLDGDVVSVAPKVGGQIKRVCAENNQKVKAGDLLVEIDPRDLAVLLDLKKAGLAAAQANVELLKANVELRQAQIDTAKATAKVSAAQVAAVQATADRAAADLKRARELIQDHTISPQEFDSAQAAGAAAQADLKAALEKAASDQSKVAEATAQLETARKSLESGEAQSGQAQADLKAAELNVSYTRITAPEDGYVTKKAIQSGDYTQVGQRLLALVPERLYVTANFKETQLREIRPGQPVSITIDSVTGRTFRGHVESIMAGSGAAFSLLPPENAVGNYVKVVQRVPVKILFDEPLNPGHVVGPGMSVEPSVRVKDYELPRFAVALAAAILALLAGGIWRITGSSKREA
jgi:membrane fusion protein (multidrug efflux system)